MPAEPDIRVTPTISIPRTAVTERFVRASGPGGQHVNKTSSAVELRFDALGSDAVPDRVKARLRGVAGRLLSSDGVLVIHADRFRSQARNREDALDRLVDLLRDAAKPPPPPRRPTKPSRGAVERRLAGKTRRGAVKEGRRRPPGDD